MTAGHGHAQAERWLHAVPDTIIAGPWSLLDQPVAFDPRSREALGSQVPHDLGRHHEAYGTRPSAVGAHGRALVDTLTESRLTGHGGGHFPVARKWRTALAAGGGGVVVANCAEGEPASAKDAALLQLRPHLVLDGLALAAEALGTREGVVWLHEGDRVTRTAVVRALEERRLAGDLSLVVRIADAPDHYLSGESSSVVRALSGGPALPYLARQPAAVSGVGGRPTLLHNAETLARVALVARYGGRTQAAGPLVTVVGRSARVVVPTRPDETFAEAVHRSGAAAGTPQAVLVGGYGGSWLPWADVAGLAIDGPGLSRWGASTGAGVVAPLESYACGLVETARLLDFLAGSSARQCGPCVFGLPALRDLVQRLASGDGGRRTLKTLERYSGEINGRGACHHPDGAVRLVATALRTFHADVWHHLDHGPCEGSAVPALLPLPLPDPA
jgi:NADH:ubiquinone oxidoreductase subunit F (NADH-binding)